MAHLYVFKTSGLVVSTGLQGIEHPSGSEFESPDILSTRTVLHDLDVVNVRGQQWGKVQRGVKWNLDYETFQTVPFLVPPGAEIHQPPHRHSAFHPTRLSPAEHGI